MAIHPTISELIPTIGGDLEVASSTLTLPEMTPSVHDSEALDEALNETFPSSDPIAVSISKVNERNGLNLSNN